MDSLTIFYGKALDDWIISIEIHSSMINEKINNINVLFSKKQLKVLK